jgi:two-component system cell cycle sensor histidine kinase/response regulator CckA
MAGGGERDARPDGGGARPNPLPAGDASTSVALRLRALLRLVQDVRDEPNLERLLQSLCGIARDTLGWDKVVITLRDAANTGLSAAASAGLSAEELGAIERVASTEPALDVWRDERFRIGRAYFFDHRITGGLSKASFFVRTGTEAAGDDAWHPDDSLVVPIETRDTRFGALIADAPVHSRRPTRAEIEELQVLADAAAYAVAGHRMQQRLVATAREAEALYRASSLLVDTTDVERLLDKILDAIDEHFGHPISTIHVREPDSDTLVLRAFRGREPASGLRISYDSGPGIVSRAARTGAAVNVPDVAIDPDYIGGIDGTASELAVPLRVGGIVIGILNVESPRRDAFTTSDERLLTSFAEHAAVALHVAQLHEKVRDKARREEVVNSIISAVSRTRDLDEILRIPCVGLAAALGVERSYVAVIDWKARVARTIHAHSLDGTDTYLGSFPLDSLPELSERLWCGEAVAVPDVFDEEILKPAWYSYEQHRTRSIVYQPVVRQGDWHAVLYVCSNRVRFWTPDELAFLRTVAEQVGTAFVQAELFDQVSRAQRDWATTFDTMSDGVLLVDGEHRIYGANAAAATLLGVDRADLMLVACCDVLAEGPGEACPAHETAAGVRVAVQRVPWRIGRATEITVDHMAGGAGAVVVLRDVSDLRQAEETARRQAAVVAQLASSASDPIAMLDAGGSVVWINEAMAEAAGIAPAAAAGRAFTELLSPDARAKVTAELARAFGGEPRFFETAIARSAGGEVWIFATLTPLFDDTEPAGVLVVGRDITGHRRAAERAAEADKLRALGQLASGVAHNFNNALSVILGRAQLLARRVADPAVLKDLGVIEQVAHEASHTVRRIQNFARRRRQETLEPIDLRALVGETIEMTASRWRGEADARGVRYNVEYLAGTGGAVVHGNESELREVFVNVIFNALDAMPNGGDLTISVDGDGASVVVRVADTGAGMDEEVKGRVFEPFFTTKGSKGTGLGLAVSYGIVSRHDGSIDYESAPGYGTVCRVTIPARDPRLAERTDGGEQVSRGAGHGKADVLVVDDDPTVLAIMSDALATRGHSVRRATSGEQALELLRERPAALVLTDLAMPGMNGVALAQAVRSSWPATRIVLMSGADVAADDASADGGAIDMTLAKPFEIDELYDVVESAIAPVGKAEGHG